MTVGAETKTHFVVDKSKCVKCGKCINTCSGMVIEFGQDGYPDMKEFELLCNAHGLGTTIMSYSAEVLNELAPKAREMLNIPKEHYTGLIVGFGYPEIEYARGVQKDRSAKTHRYSERKGR